jgi:formylglycine-generating enzyme required for sulfatase activity
MTDCGPTTESCCTSLDVPGGTYDRTYTNSGSGPTAEADPATVSSFRLDKYLVTVGRFRQFVSAWDGGAGWTPLAGSGKHVHLNAGDGLWDVGSASAVGPVFETGWVTSDNSNISPTDANLACDALYQTWTSSAGSQEDLPMNCVNWYEAYAFCIWDNAFLPSEAEWEYAAAAGDQEREYPWGSTDPGAGNQYAIYDCDYPSERDGGLCDKGVGNIAPVGTATLGAAAWGQLDMAGEVYEWTLDWDVPYVDPCTDCVNLEAPDAGLVARVVRGGRFNLDAAHLLAAYRGPYSPSNRGAVVGFRCARTP